MFKWRRMKQMSAFFDGETRHAGSAPRRLDDPESRDFLCAMGQLREGARQQAQAPEISDAQFSAFMVGIREGLVRPEPRLSPLWTMASLSAAALVLVVSLLVVFSRGADPVRAGEVESAHTELEGVTVDYYENPEGIATVWVTMPESDLW